MQGGMNIELVLECDTKKPGRPRNKPKNANQPKEEKEDDRIQLMKELGH
jgi:hypothetical protein